MKWPIVPHMATISTTDQKWPRLMWAKKIQFTAQIVAKTTAAQNIICSICGDQSQPQVGLNVPSQQSARPSSHPQTPPCHEQHPLRSGSRVFCGWPGFNFCSVMLGGVLLGFSVSMEAALARSAVESRSMAVIVRIVFFIISSLGVVGQLQVARFFRCKVFCNT